MFTCATNHTVKDINDDEIINRVLEEGLKLKKKCKSLHRLLEETEAQRNQDRVMFNSVTAKLTADHIHEVDRIRQDLASELTALQERHQSEVEALLGKIEDNSVINVHLQQENDHLRKVVVDIEEQRSTARANREVDIETNHEQRNQERDDKLSQLEQQLEQLQKQLMTLQDQNIELQSEVERLTCENNTLLNSRPIAQRNAEENSVSPIGLEAKLAYAKDEIIELKSQLSMLLNAKTLVEKGVQEVLQENKSLKDNLRSMLLTKVPSS